ncbi:unnamed protein product, partial [Amoebophrya sp. A120]
CLAESERVLLSFQAGRNPDHDVGGNNQANYLDELQDGASQRYAHALGPLAKSKVQPGRDATASRKFLVDDAGKAKMHQPASSPSASSLVEPRVLTEDAFLEYCRRILTLPKYLERVSGSRAKHADDAYFE